MKILIYIVGMALVLASCGSVKTSQLEAPVDMSPAWVKSRPMSSMDYIGIGRAVKSGASADYEAIARRNALNDLASEIEIKVSSNSLLYTLEHNDQFSESYTQSIQSSTSLNLEGFEVTDSYQDKDYYWIYYRLNKGLYESHKQQAKKEAVERALAQLKLAEGYVENRDIQNAAQSYLASLQELEAYWGETNISSDADYGSESIDVIALNGLSNMRSAYTISSIGEQINLNESNDFRAFVKAYSQLNGQETKAVPFEIYLGKSNKEERFSSAVELAIAPQDEIQSLLTIESDPFKSIRKENRNTSLSFLNELLKPESVQINVYTQYPKISILSKSKSVNGIEGEAAVLRSALVQSLAEYGIGVDESNASPYLIDISSSARDGGLTSNFQIVYTDVNIIAKNIAKNETVYSTRLESIKGVHKDIPNAEGLSLKKCGEELDKTLLKPLIEAMF